MFRNNAIKLIEKFGLILNPFILKFAQEDGYILIFYFHGFYDSLKQKKMNHIDPQNNFTIEEFKIFIEYFLERGYLFISAGELSGDLRKDKRYVLLTFDDGYFNNTMAINLLNHYNIPTLLFIPTINITESKSFWWDIVYKFRSKQGVEPDSIQNEHIYLKTLKSEEIEQYIVSNFGENSYSPWSDIDRPLTKSELIEISKNKLVTIGNHTHSHAILTVCNRMEIEEEFNISNSILSDITGSKPNCISFPNGNYNDTVLEVAREVGFSFAFAIDHAKNSLQNINEGFTCLKRFLPTPNINEMGPFYRLGYIPKVLPSRIKSRLKLPR
jgi:peptidoglycan/xylan/chitin deacetylase (PgdA/CDA1 family)